ncbi:transposase [Candidatus Lariskella endosymbiont of Epinotia ramella]|uniref:transposase n=1 Tax=Candidatus Lariskella endosymbiont of Epinotia ramella TaxID=3066224 RepID=UPI0039776BDD
MKFSVPVLYCFSYSIGICRSYRIYSHKVFKEFAKRSKTTKGRFFGLKLYLIKVSFSSGNEDYRKALR